eukprot:CAMPEP_0173448908 /NCGR_PEP_ID=MMETSP1357-20121228/41687_1 /TAXON_ID=77926 /ORGANISM="Hemiselmis rufescens, Strain PCC563" /LENGTH=59 /DNA_ID=CAMNT_0014415455 /DNA_START=18 /DNA_END=197 /DNA_ORIENTATION=-
MLSMMWNAATTTAHQSTSQYFAGMSTPSDPAYRDDPTRVTGRKGGLTMGHGADQRAIFG